MTVSGSSSKVQFIGNEASTYNEHIIQYKQQINTYDQMNTYKYISNFTNVELFASTFSKPCKLIPGFETSLDVVGKSSSRKKPNPITKSSNLLAEQSILSPVNSTGS